MKIEDVKFDEVVSATATGVTTINSSILDMAGYEGVIFITSLGTADVTNGHKIQQGAASNMSDAADLLGSARLCNGTGKVIVSRLHRPRKRYVRCSVLRPVTTTINSVQAIRYGARSKPVTNHVTNSMAVEELSSPAEGTA